MSIVLKKGDTRQAIKAVLKDADDTPVDLTDCSVSFVMAPLRKSATINRGIHIEDAEGGEVWVVWNFGETDTAGTFLAEIVVEYPDGKRETFPHDGYINIQIMENIE